MWQEIHSVIHNNCIPLTRTCENIHPLKQAATLYAFMGQVSIFPTIIISFFQAECSHLISPLTNHYSKLSSDNFD